MRHMPTSMRALGLCLGAGLAAIALAGCSSTGTASASAQSTGTATVPAGATTSAASAPAAPSGTGAAAAGSGSGSGQSGSASSADACTTSDLSLQVFEGPQAGPAADGSDPIGVYVVLANTSHSTCTTYGYPGVDFYLGAKDLREQTTRTTSGGSPATVSLAPGGQATSYITYPGGAVCDAVADTVQVIPPNQTTALRAPIDYVGGSSGSKQFDVCDGNIDVGPLQAGYDGPH
jgi:hypothetical protein